MKPMKQLRIDYFARTPSYSVWKAIDPMCRWDSDNEQHPAYVRLHDAIRDRLHALQEHFPRYGQVGMVLQEQLA